VEPASPDRPDEVVIKGIASTVALDYRNGLAHKIYKPGRLVRLLYWLAFQAPFPYVSNPDAIEASRQRRRIVGLLTKFWYGADLVAPVVDIHEEDDGRIAFVSQLVAGAAPVDKWRARKMLRSLARRFSQAGLPTWQISPVNPRAPGNLIALEDGSYRIIDLESNIVAPVEPLTALVGAIRSRNFPAFDDIDTQRLRRYLDAHADELEAALGAEHAELREAAGLYAAYAARWHAVEPRLIGKTLRFLLGLVDVPSWWRWLQRIVAEAELRADAHIRKAVGRWSAEGRLQPAQADSLREVAASHDLRLAISNLGVHLGLSVFLRFPFGSLARFLWVAAMRVRAECLRFRDKEESRRQRAVHTLPVLVASLTPGFGAGAYLLSAPLKENRALVAIVFDGMLARLPLSLYRRLRLGRLTEAVVRRWSESGRLDLPPAAMAGEA
jgi:hypothetical protein